MLRRHGHILSHMALCILMISRLSMQHQWNAQVKGHKVQTASDMVWHYIDVIITTVSQITSLTVVYSIFYSDSNQRKHQSSSWLVFVWGIHRDRWIPTQRASYVENVSICWRHHGLHQCVTSQWRNHSNSKSNHFMQWCIHKFHWFMWNHVT